MAIVKRESGAWKAVVNKLKQDGILVNTEYELLKMLDIEKSKHTEFPRFFEQKRQEADKCCKNEIAQLFSEQKSSLSLVRKEFSRKIHPIQYRIDILEEQQDEANSRGLFYKLFHLFEMIKLSSEVKKVKLKLRKIILEKDNKLKELYSSFDRERLEVNQRRDDVKYALEKEVYGTKRRIDVIEEILKSNNYSGAAAELKMIGLLRKLPDNYHIINDVSIKLNKTIRFNGEYISSVQIDHLVIGPSGIFIIEVKNWSRKFAAEGNFFDPYKQIKRHNRACYILLKEQIETKLRSIISYANHFPPKTDEKYIKVMPIEQVVGYILWFQEEIHSNQEIEQIVRFFEGKINDTVFW